MVSSLTLSASVSTQSEAAWEVHTISRRAAPLLIRLKEGEAVVTMVTSLHLQLYILTYGLINRLLPSFALFLLLVVGEGRRKIGRTFCTSLLLLNQQESALQALDFKI